MFLENRQLYVNHPDVWGTSQPSGSSDCF